MYHFQTDPDGPATGLPCVIESISPTHCIARDDDDQYLYAAMAEHPAYRSAPDPDYIETVADDDVTREQAMARELMAMLEACANGLRRKTTTGSDTKN